MVKTFTSALLYALENIRTNFFHTLLSVVGITIGVSALIAILSMIDGLEQYAEDQISSTTSVKVVEVSSVTVERMDGVAIRKDDPVIITSEMHQEMISGISVPIETYRVSEAAKEIMHAEETHGSLVYYSDAGYAEKYELISGTHLFDSGTLLQGRNRAVVDSVFAARIEGGSYQPQDVLGTHFEMDGLEIEIMGIVEGYSQNPEILVQIDLLSVEQMKSNPPFIAIEAVNVEDVPVVKSNIQSWLESSPYSSREINVFSQDTRVSQATQGFQLFRIVMGLIVGISVVVGGVGVMNVLLISVTQRTKEIGVRKAVGSKKSDIYVQFLSESMVVSLFGTVVGIVFGIVISLAFVPIVHQITEVPLRPTFSLITILIITLFSLLIGVFFGTFPAYKASQLRPMDALRRE